VIDGALSQFTFRRTRLEARDLAWLQAAIDEGGSLQDVAVKACRRFGWVRPNGEPPVSSCSTMFRRLEQRALLRIPALARRFSGAARHRHTDRRAFLEALGTVPGMVECQPTGPLTVRPIAPEERDGFLLHLQRYHYLGFERSVGESLGYAAMVGNELVALLDWGAAVLHCRPRDQHVGWDRAAREGNLGLVADNRRFLILPWIRIPHLASRILGANLRRLSRDWELAYGHEILLAETFVDTTRFLGTCYRASNWLCVGQTLGFTRLRRGFEEHRRPKSVWLFPLARRALQRLRWEPVRSLSRGRQEAPARLPSSTSTTTPSR
jgi:hypothetical protein